MAVTRGRIRSLTLLGNQSLVELNDASGHPQPPLPLMITHGNYNAMMAGLLLASANRYEVELDTEFGSEISGIQWIKVITS